MNRIFTIALSFVLMIFSFPANAQDSIVIDKKVLTHDVYPHWKNISKQQISANGKWVCYEINPQKGDGYLYLYNIETKKLDSIARGARAEIAPSSDYMAFVIVPQYDTLRKMKLDKVPKKKLPKDSLGIWIFSSDSMIKIAKVKGFKMARENSAWMAYTMADPKKKPKKTEKKKGFLFFKKKNKEKPKKAIKQKGDYIIVFNPIDNKRIEFENVSELNFNHFGSSIALITNIKKDSTTEVNIQILHTQDLSIDTILNREGRADKISLDRKGGQVTFLFAADTAKKNKVYELYYWVMGDTSAQLIADTTTKGMTQGWSPSINSSPYFSRNASRIYFGNALKPEQEPKDTLLAKEKYQVDIWNYQDPLLQSQQKIMRDRELKRTYEAVYLIGEKRMQQLADTNMASVRISLQGNGTFGIGYDNQKYQREQSWDGRYNDVYIVNVFDGSRELVLEHHMGYAGLSTDGHYLLYYKNTDSVWYAYDHKARQHRALTKELNVNFYNERHDTPQLPRAYGAAGWFSDDKYVIIRDRYDLWKIDPSMSKAPENLTKSYGREHKIRFTPITLDPDHWYFNDENPHMLMAFNEETKQSGYYQIDLNEGSGPAEMVMTDHRYYYPLKAKKANQLIWRRSSFHDYYNVFTSTTDIQNIEQISDANPQQKDYLWGNVELVKWTAFDGEKLEGLLYKPENFDSTVSYPVIVYFYERYSDDIHNHYIPKPSHSVINFTEYVSNGYIVFIPDITYKTGHPAKSAYNAIVSGTEYLKTFPWVDAKHMGIQGQSWGGYQVAMLVTQTDIYACAESGAPVTNMFSAYGGIRWGSGMSRAFQYEKGQSRMGVSPWESPELYIENSPIFHAAKVNTPLLIMHNDMDGAVPWWQGIEYFTDLRRLGKQVWMLTYNGDDHNLRKWPNRVDLSIRMMQFFDHYLKEKPMPIWMSKGIPATKKGKMDGYELKE
ncbi:MAG: S9 family peptidase [Bacteroidetes bacterium]|nr:MAG: S9 family peptidase [Bacteroidota bacterium]